MNRHDFYQQLGPNSDPGELAHLYTDLPESLTELCQLIKRQLIHPSQRAEYRKQLPRGVKEEDARFVSVQQMLAVLQRRNPAGLTMRRIPRQRLIVSCRYHAILLASILKFRGRPTRVRVGFAGYLSDRPGKYINHWICEVWHEGDGRWLFVDSDTMMVDFPRPEFKLAGDVWLAARKGLTYPSLYGIGRWWGWEPIRRNLFHDFACCLGVEPTYWQGPPLFRVKTKDLTKSQGRLLDQMAELLQDPDENLAVLQALCGENEALQMKDDVGWRGSGVAMAVSPAPFQSRTGKTASGISFKLECARPEDAKALALVSWKAFADDVNYGAPAKGGPPGCRSDKWQAKMMQAGDYFKIVDEGDQNRGRIIGGAIIFDQGKGLIVLGRIFIHPDYQNKGIGSQVMLQLERAYPQARHWRLGTPEWNKRNHAFYRKMGYEIVGRKEEDGVLFEKMIDTETTNDFSFVNDNDLCE
ncbi:MAG: GNAT family N-acetyltransferase [Chloroflexi bacterium]|nr:GNAT family N-acetyltransferase [Chloroflexota bacterium]